MKPLIFAMILLGAGCARATGGAGHSADAAPPGARDDGGVLDPDAAASIDASQHAVDASHVVGPDAACWWCGLPTGTISLTFVLTQSDCVTDYADGDEDRGGAGFAVVVAGTSPNGLHVDAYSAGGTYSEKTCTVPLGADGTWECSVDYLVSNTQIGGHLMGLTMYGYESYSDSQRDTICSNLVGVGQ